MKLKHEPGEESMRAFGLMMAFGLALVLAVMVVVHAVLTGGAVHR